MSIASELTALAANKAAIKSAIESMTGATESAALNTWPNAITQITRRPNRGRASTTAEPVYTPDAGKTAFVVRVYDDGEHGLEFVVGYWSRIGGHSSVTVDWGDGNSTVSTANGTVRLSHYYSSAGDYLVQISDDVSQWCPHLENIFSGFGGYDGLLPQGTWSQVVDDGRTMGYWSVCNILKVHRFIQWGASVSSAGGTFSGCQNLVGTIPAWGESVTSTYKTYSGCPGISGAVPKWTAKITSSQECYSGCSGLTGDIPAWGAAITNASSTYSGCSGLTGDIPAWGVAITNAESAYSGCSGLTGNIPAWNSSMSNASGTYYNCSGLRGPIPAWGAAITNAFQTYYNCTGLTGSVPEWNSSITNAYFTYYRCVGLTGNIPPWGAALTNVQSVYQCCAGLSGVWTSGGATPPDSELMPSSITSKSSCVDRTTDSLRAYFLTSWGGSRAS